MRILSLITLLMCAIAWGQAAPSQQGAAPQTGQTPKAERHDDDTEPPPASAANVPQDAAVITVEGFCDKPNGKPPANSDCRTVITRAQFETLVDALNPQLPGPVRRQLAETYPRLLVFADKARELGLDKDPGFREMMRYATLQLLTQRVTRHLQQVAGNISDADIDAYYKENSIRFQRAELLRIFIPKQKQLASAGGSAAQNKAADEAAMKATAEKIHEEATAGKDFQQLQKQAFDAAGIASTAPKVEMGKMAPTSIPVNHKKVFELRAGQVSELINDPGGYYIYKVVSKEMVPLSQARAEIHNSIQSERMQASTESLTKAIKVDLNQEYFVGTPGSKNSPRSAGMTDKPAEK